MNYKKILAVIFGVLSLGALQETYRVLTSQVDQDIVEHRPSLILISVPITSLFIYLAFRYWKKSKDANPKL
jgi:hypothetical protein